MLLALGWLALITILNILGLKLGKWLDNFCAMGAWIPGAVLLALAATFARHFGSATRFAAAQFSLPTPTSGTSSSGRSSSSPSEATMGWKPFPFRAVIETRK
jgi:amino acid transporter